MEEYREISRPQAYAVIAFLGVSLLFASAGISQLASTWNAESEEKSNSEDIAQLQPGRFPDVPLLATAAVVYDVKNDLVLYDKNGEAQLPLASLSKIMVALTALDLLPEDTVVAISQEFLNQEGNNGFTEGQEWRLSEILDATLVESSNDGAAAIAVAYAALLKETGSETPPEKKFLQAMNQKAASLGLSQTYFLNETGLDENALSPAATVRRETPRCFLPKP